MFRILCDPSIREYRAVLDWNYCGVCTVRPVQPAVPYTHTHTHHRFKITLPNTDQAHDKNICESLRVISVKHSSVLPDDGSHKIRNM
jgi:hypothetical protein